MSDLGWRDLLLDDRLRACVELSLRNNRDLRVSAANIARSRAQYRIQEADQLPSVIASGSMTREHTRGETQASYSVEIGLASYEIDFFSRVKNLRDASLQSYLATLESERSVRISLIADVANAWLTFAADAKRLAVAQSTLDSDTVSLRLTKMIHELGASSGLSVAQAQAALETARLNVASYRAQLDQDRNALDLLSGTDVPQDLLPSTASQGESVVLVGLPPGLPAESLLNRPDVLAAERSLRSAQLDIGAARAALFPSISLTGSAGTSSNELSSLFKPGSRGWTFAPSIDLPLFNGGARRAGVDEAVAARDVALWTYEKVIQTAFREVADALAVRQTITEQITAQRAQTQASATQLALAEALFRHGSTSYLDVLSAQRTLYSSQLSEISLQLSEEVNRITLYRALGGGKERS